jgi:bile acid:Na+ symporter, BASS family
MLGHRCKAIAFPHTSPREKDGMMTARTSAMSPRTDFIHRHLLALIVLSYGLAATCPAWGSWIKDARIVVNVVPYGPASVTLPGLLLAFLLFNAGLRARRDRIREILRRPGVVLVGLVANIVIPVGYVLILSAAMQCWHNADEAATILVGLALVAAMPVAGSSTGWAQTADGDMALSLGLVLASTLLSPMTTPVALHLVGFLSPQGYAEELHRLAGRETGLFLMMWVLLPSILGLLAREVLGEERVAAVERRLKTPSAIALLVLCYANASACLPHALGHPDWDFLAITTGVVGGLCVLTFTTGYALSCLLGTNRGQRAALMYGLGMNNNGTGLVLVSVALSSRPLAMLPIIAYNLTQHLVAGCVHALLSGEAERFRADDRCKMQDARC